MRMSEIAKAAGMTVSHASWIANLPSWEGVRVGDVDAFMHACGIHRDNMWKHKLFLKRQFQRDNPLEYIEELDSKERSNIKKCIQKVLSSPTQET